MKGYEQTFMLHLSWWMITVPTSTGKVLVYFYETVFIYMYVTGREVHINYNPTQEFVIKVQLPFLS